MNLKKPYFMNLIIISLTITIIYSGQVQSQQSLESLYTIQQAQTCFHSQALPTCQQQIQKCLYKQQCQKELTFYQDCNFEKQYSNQIFNGNCFQNWKKFSIYSKQVINCLDKACNLAEYNSQVSLSILYSCTSQALIQNYIECNDECQQVLKRLISSRIPYEPIKKIYYQTPQIKTQNENIQKILQIIKNECIDENGSIRKRHEKDLADKKRNKQKMYDQMNEQLKNNISAQGNNKEEMNEEKNRNQSQL